MKKKLQTIGNSLGIVIDKPILDLLRIDRDTELDVSTDGERLIIITPDVPKKTRVTRELVRDIMDKYDSTLRKLAK
jgi:antitoxin MazE